MSKCQGPDEMFPPPGIPDFKPEHDFPTRFTNFHWWGELAKNKRVCYKSIRRDELPIPPLQDERWRYPYRYSSAGPARSGIEWRDRRMGMQKGSKDTKHLLSVRPMEPRDVRQIKGYGTTSMDAALEPFLYHAPSVIVKKEIPLSLLTPTWAPKCARTHFGQYILEDLHRNYRTDPKIRRRIQFCSMDSNREVCVAESESGQLTSKPQKKVKKRDFLFVQQGPGHKATDDPAPLVCGPEE